MGKTQDEIIKAEVELRRPDIAHLRDKLNGDWTPEQLKGPASLGLVNSLLAQLAVMQAHAADERLERVERKCGILRNARPITRSVTRVLSHDPQGRIEQFEKVEGGDEELDVLARLREVEARMVEVEQGGIKYLGVYDKDAQYRPGHCVTHKGSMWVALIDSVGVKPGEAQGCWRLAVKAGRDAKDARNVEPVLK